MYVYLLLKHLTATTCNILNISSLTPSTSMHTYTYTQLYVYNTVQQCACACVCVFICLEVYPCQATIALLLLAKASAFVVGFLPFYLYSFVVVVVNFKLLLRLLKHLRVQTIYLSKPYAKQQGFQRLVVGSMWHKSHLDYFERKTNMYNKAGIKVGRTEPSTV